MCKSWQHWADFEKNLSSKLLSLRVFSTNVNQCPKFVLTSCPFCCCFNLVLMWQKALKNKLKNALTDSPKLSFKSHFVPITLFWDKQSSWHLPLPLALICVPYSYCPLSFVQLMHTVSWCTYGSAWVLYEVAHRLHSWLILILELTWKWKLCSDPIGKEWASPIVKHPVNIIMNLNMCTSHKVPGMALNSYTLHLNVAFTPRW
jgi:hypothetical protein